MSEAEEERDKQIKGVIFDLDNTLVDFVEAKINACDDVVGFLDRDDSEELLHHFFKGPYDIENPKNIGEYLKERGIYTEEALETCSDIYISTKIDSIYAYPGVVDTLSKLREHGYQLALLTDALADNARERLNKAGISGCFDVIVTFDVTGKKKPHLEPYKRCLEDMGLKAEEVLLVGDSLHRDIEPGKKLGMQTVYARYGDRNLFEKREVEPDFEIDEIGELVGILGL